MKSKFLMGLVVSFFGFIPFWAQAMSSQPVTLGDAFQAALKNSEAVAIQTENVLQTQESRSQATGSLLPQITGTASYFIQQTPDSATNIFPSSQPLIKLSADQPLFRGLREYAAIRQRKDLEEVAESTRKQAGIQLLYDVTTSFYTVATAEQDIRDLDQEIGFNQKRISELNAFRKIGRSRESEVLTLRANLASLEAQKEISRGQLEVARKTFAYLTGLSPTTLIIDNEPEVHSLGIPEAFLARVELRPDVQAARGQYEASGENVHVAFGQHLPSADLLGNYYFLRSGALQNTTWDAQVILTVPLFSGGVTQSLVRQAESQERQAELTLQNTKRLAIEQIESFYASVASDQSQVVKLTSATQLATQSYQAEQKDYRNGLVTNLEVLQALTASQENQRLLDRVKFTQKADFVKLQAATQNRKEISLIP